VGGAEAFQLSPSKTARCFQSNRNGTCISDRHLCSCQFRFVDCLFFLFFPIQNPSTLYEHRSLRNASCFFDCRLSLDDTCHVERGCHTAKVLWRLECDCICNDRPLGLGEDRGRFRLRPNGSGLWDRHGTWKWELQFRCLGHPPSSVRARVLVFAPACPVRVCPYRQTSSKDSGTIHETWAGRSESVVRRLSCQLLGNKTPSPFTGTFGAFFLCTCICLATADILLVLARTRNPRPHLPLPRPFGSLLSNRSRPDLRTHLPVVPSFIVHLVIAPVRVRQMRPWHSLSVVDEMKQLVPGP
jgi:hypothetical protein